MYYPHLGNREDSPLIIRKFIRHYSMWRLYNTIYYRHRETNIYRTTVVRILFALANICPSPLYSFTVDGTRSHGRVRRGGVKSRCVETYRGCLRGWNRRDIIRQQNVTDMHIECDRSVFSPIFSLILRTSELPTRDSYYLSMHMSIFFSSAHSGWNC